MELIGIAVFWVVCGVIAYGRAFAHFQREWPHLAKKERRADQVIALVAAASGPWGLLISLILGKHGMMFRALKDKPNEQ